LSDSQKRICVDPYCWIRSLSDHLIVTLNLSWKLLENLFCQTGDRFSGKLREFDELDNISSSNISPAVPHSDDISVKFVHIGEVCTSNSNNNDTDRHGAGYNYFVHTLLHVMDRSIRQDKASCIIILCLLRSGLSIFNHLI